MQGIHTMLDDSVERAVRHIYMHAIVDADVFQPMLVWTIHDSQKSSSGTKSLLPPRVQNPVELSTTALHFRQMTLV